MNWLGPGDDVLLLLRGSCDDGVPATPRPETLFYLLLLIVTCSALLALVASLERRRGVPGQRAAKDQAASMRRTPRGRSSG
jgi:hypothetical protein